MLKYKKTLNRSDLNTDPMKQFESWFEEAKSALPNPEVVSLATVDEHGHPALRHVLLKQYRDEGFVFYTNYLSDKAKHISTNNQVALSFLWEPLERQVNIQGYVKKLDTHASEQYFLSRASGSRVSAWCSRQSCVILNRKKLEADYQAEMERWKDKNITCPPFWGGYLVCPTQVEFWQGRAHRLHDRFCYKHSKNAGWFIDRLSP